MPPSHLTALLLSQVTPALHTPLSTIVFFSQYFISDRHLQRSIHRTKNIKIDLLSAYKRNI